MELKFVTALKFPASKPNGEPWDLYSNTLPDLTVKLYKDTVEVWASTQVYLEAANNKQYDFRVVPAVAVDATARYRLMLFDFDIHLPGGQEWMGGIEFTPYQSGLKFPDTLTYDCPNCPVGFRAAVSYQF